MAYVLGAFVLLQMTQLVLSGRLIALAHFFKQEVEELHTEHAKQAQLVHKKAWGGKVGVEQARAATDAAVRDDGVRVIGVWRALHPYTSAGPAEEGELPDLPFQKGDEIHPLKYLKGTL